MQLCSYAVLLLILLYLAMAIIGSADKALPLSSFLLVLFYASVITAANALYPTIRLKTAYRVAIHYAILLLGFVCVYLINGIVRSQQATKVWSAVLIFTAAYAACYGIFVGVRALLVSKGRASVIQHSRKAEDTGKKQKSEYRPRFSDTQD